MTAHIPGYDYGEVPHSPVTLDELAHLKATTGFTDEDQRTLHRAKDIFIPSAEALVDSWRKIIASQEHLARWFFGPDGKPDERYKAAVKARFVQWVEDLCTRPLDQAWLDYQHEIGLRHTPVKKNLTDHTHTPSVVPLRYLLTFIMPVLQSIRPFLRSKGVKPEEIDRIDSAWGKAFILTVTLWSRPYVKDDLW